MPCSSSPPPRPHRSHGPRPHTLYGSAVQNALYSDQILKTLNAKRKDKESAAPDFNVYHMAAHSYSMMEFPMEVNALWQNQGFGTKSLVYPLVSMMKELFPMPEHGRYENIPDTEMWICTCPRSGEPYEQRSWDLHDSGKLHRQIFSLKLLEKFDDEPTTLDLLTMALDPRQKLSMLRTEEHRQKARTALIDLISREYSEYLAPAAPTAPPKPKRRRTVGASLAAKMFGDAAAAAPARAKPTVSAETAVDNYLNIPLYGGNIEMPARLGAKDGKNPLKWYRKHFDDHPAIAMAAAAHLAAHAGTGQLENRFSASGRNDRKGRHLGKESQAALTMVCTNPKLLPDIPGAFGPRIRSQADLRTHFLKRESPSKIEPEGEAADAGE